MATAKRYPFKFLDAYTREDAAFFFGREEEIEALYAMVFQTDLILVHGASGTGKTSLIQCGLASKFQPYDWLALNVRRGKDLNASLGQALREAGGGLPAGDALDWLDEWDGETPAPAAARPAAEALSPVAQRLKAIYLRHFKPLYLIFDQFEELYILGTKAEQQQFIATVRDILRVEQPVKVILSIREEYLGHLYEFERAVPELLRKKLRVEPMNLERVKTVILGVGSRPEGNVRLEAGHEAAIAEGIFDKIRGQDKSLHIPLPYLQVFLDKFYLKVAGDESRQAEATFTRAALHDMSGLGDVLRNFLDEQAAAISRAEGLPEADIWRALSPFVTLEGTKEPLSEAQLAARLPGLPADAPSRLLQAFVRGRILRFSESSQLYEIAHDALAKQIHTKRSDEEIAILEVQRLVKSQAAMKAEAREHFTEKQLLFMAPYLEKFTPSAEEQEWIEESRAAAERQKEEAERRQREELEKAQRQAEQEKRLRDKAEAALAEVRLKNASIFESFAGLGIELMYKLDHAGALEKLKVAAEIDVDSRLKKQQLTEAVAELLYFFAEGGRRLALARTAAGLLLRLQPEGDLAQALRQCVAEGWEARAQFAPLLEKLPFFQKFQARYYPEMVSIPLGEDGVFEMGSPESEWGRSSDELLHKVKLSPYQMAAAPVTFYQFALFSEAVERGLASRTPYWGRFGDHPVVSVSWYEAAEYANWLNAQLGLPPCYTILKEKNSDKNNQVRLDYLKWKVDWDSTARGFRLPTEAEWELAARGGVGAPRTLYAGSDKLDDVGWYWQNSGDKPLEGDWDLNKIYDNNGRTHTVKGKSDNGIGIYDMSGNVYEWCWDWYDANYYDECQMGRGKQNRLIRFFSKVFLGKHQKENIEFNPLGAESSTDGRVFRGGSWLLSAECCRVAARFRRYPGFRYNFVGFRLTFVP